MHLISNVFIGQFHSCLSDFWFACKSSMVIFGLMEPFTLGETFPHNLLNNLTESNFRLIFYLLLHLY